MYHHQYFHLWTKNRSDEVPKLDMEDDRPLMMSPVNSEYKENILGYIVRKLQKSIDCNVCNNAMVSSNKSYFNLSLVVTQKDRAGLVYPLTDIVKILSIAERIFKSFVVSANNLNPGISSSKYLRLKMTNFIMSELSNEDVFTELFYHDHDYHNDISEDFHSTQIKKAVIKEFLNLRLFRYGQEYSRCVLIKNCIGKRHQLQIYIIQRPVVTLFLLYCIVYFSTEVYLILLNEPLLSNFSATVASTSLQQRHSTARCSTLN